MLGMLTSVMIRSMGRLRAICNATTPSGASTTVCPVAFRANTIIRRIVVASSTVMIVLLMEMGGASELA
jgi:hypothetical protein